MTKISGYKDKGVIDVSKYVTRVIERNTYYVFIKRYDREVAGDFCVFDRRI